MCLCCWEPEFLLRKKRHRNTQQGMARKNLMEMDWDWKYWCGLLISKIYQNVYMKKKKKKKRMCICMHVFVHMCLRMHLYVWAYTYICMYIFPNFAYWKGKKQRPYQSNHKHTEYHNLAFNTIPTKEKETTLYFMEICWANYLKINIKFICTKACNIN